MPIWVQVILGLAALIVAVGTIWNKLLKPGIKAASTADEMLPLLRDLTEVFKDSPHAFEVLDDIAKQFRTDGGSSLRDLVNRLETSANANASAVMVLETRVRALGDLTAEDRREVAALAVLLGKVLAAQVDAADKREGVASDLAKAQTAVDQVASDLADRRKDE